MTPVGSTVEATPPKLPPLDVHPPELLPTERLTPLTGYGLTNRAHAYLFRPSGVDEVREVFNLARRTDRGVVLRGAGRSYGDASLGAECLGIDMSRLHSVLSWDKETGVIEVQGGVTVEGLWRYCLEDGWWPPVVSGTMFPTMAGALAMNIHGKNNFRMGTLGEHVRELDLLAPSGELLTLTPEDELFRAAISSAGLLGMITRVKIGMKRVHSGDLQVLATSCRNWDEQFAAFERHEADADYMVSWIDAFPAGPAAGRGLFHSAWHIDAEGNDPLSLRESHQDLPDRIMGLFPKSSLWRILKGFNHRPGMRVVNAAKHRASATLGNGKLHRQSLVAFSFLLDYVPNWRHAYLPGGFIQYQSFVPKDRAPEVFARQLEMAREERLEPFLAVLKRHRPDPFLFSHGVDGYSLALDFKVSEKGWPRLQALCHAMNDLVLAAGGRFYFAKDSTLRPEDARAYLGDEALATFHAHKARLDPDHLLTSELARRLKLV